jgi:exodeoxyribonuclease-5
MTEIVLSKDQEEAYDKLITWTKNFDNNKFKLTGYAGTGKSTLISKLQKDCKLSIAYTAFTGKASNVLRNKLNANDVEYAYVGTIHRLIYEPRKISEKETIFILKKELKDIELIVIDEASMLGKRLLTDLESFDIPLLLVGDKGQLPPVKDEAGVDLNESDAFLNVIHRQAENNPIIMFSKDIRENKHIPYGRYAKNILKLSQRETKHADFINKILENYKIDKDIVLCGYNRTRQFFNKEIRRHLGFYGEYPNPGEKIICLKNNYSSGTFNGMIGVVIDYNKNIYEYKYKKQKLSIGEYRINFEDYGIINGYCLEQQFFNQEVLNDEFYNVKKFLKKDLGYNLELDLLDFGYSISTYKAQGSGFDNVIVYEEKCPKLWDQTKWNYTAVTRAINKLIFITK